MFAFASGRGTDTVTDFRNGQDKFDVKGVAGLSNFAQLSVAQSGADTKIGYGGDYILLKSIAIATIDATDFIFT